MWHHTIGLIVTLALSILMAPLAAKAQPSAKVPRIGWLSLTSLSAAPHMRDVFRQGLRERGWVEGQNIVIEERYAEGKSERLLALAAELVQLKVDILLTPGDLVAQAAKEATTTIPIVAVPVSDPVATGLVASLTRPGGNITGLSTLAPEISGKSLELLKEIVPGITRVAVLRNTAYPCGSWASRLWRVLSERGRRPAPSPAGRSRVVGAFSAADSAAPDQGVARAARRGGPFGRA